MKPHSDKVNDLQRSADEMMFITASKDNTAKLYDTESMQTLKTYKTDRPVNSAAISPIRDQVFTVLVAAFSLSFCLLLHKYCIFSVCFCFKVAV